MNLQNHVSLFFLPRYLAVTYLFLKFVLNVTGAHGQTLSFRPESFTEFAPNLVLGHSKKPRYSLLNTKMLSFRCNLCVSHVVCYFLQRLLCGTASLLSLYILFSLISSDLLRFVSKCEHLI